MMCFPQALRVAVCRRAVTMLGASDADDLYFKEGENAEQLLQALVPLLCLAVSYHVANSMIVHTLQPGFDKRECCMQNSFHHCRHCPHFWCAAVLELFNKRVTCNVNESEITPSCFHHGSLFCCVVSSSTHCESRTVTSQEGNMTAPVVCEQANQQVEPAYLAKMLSQSTAKEAVGWGRVRTCLLQASCPLWNISRLFLTDCHTFVRSCPRYDITASRLQKLATPSADGCTQRGAA